jgi:hypothetical protein
MGMKASESKKACLKAKGILLSKSVTGKSISEKVKSVLLNSYFRSIIWLLNCVNLFAN